jgi:hypothetical protein
MPEVECPVCREPLWLEINEEVITVCFHCGNKLIRVGDHYAKAEDLYVHDDLT